MTNPTPKKKKQNINRELTLGGCIAIFTSPLILLAFVLGLYGFLIAVERFIRNSSLNYTQPISLLMMAGFGFLWMILLWVGLKFMLRFRNLIQAQQYLKAEQARVSHLVNTSSAVDRLQVHDKSSDIVQMDLESEKHFDDESST